MRTSKPLIIITGGFLGAGKTTLILCAADMLRRQGARVAVITNDQGADLVDTYRMRASGFDTAEIAGGCFCCRFSAFIDSVEHVMQYQPEIIFAEPVGSCTDLVATVVQPLESLYADQFRIAPFSVLVDPAMARRATKPGAEPAFRFLFETQVREADVLCYAKADQNSDFPKINGEDPLRLSALTGEGVRDWLGLLTGWTGECGQKPLRIDYDQYAAAEAALGWLNAHVHLDLNVPASPSRIVGPLLDELDTELSRIGAIIAHLKLFDQTDSSYLKAAIVDNGQEPAVEGDLLAPAERKHHLIINVRAIAKPEALRRIVTMVVDGIEGDRNVQIQSFSPAYPRPERRIAAR